MKKRLRLVRSCMVLRLPLVAATVAGCGGGMPEPTPVTLTLSNVPTGCPTTETAADLYSTAVANTCATDNCHGTNANSFHLLSAADLKEQLVGKPSTLYSGVKLPLVTAGDINKSFLMYKITGSQGPYGSKMPIGKAFTSDQVCKFVAWINSGAN